MLREPLAVLGDLIGCAPLLTIWHHASTPSMAKALAKTETMDAMIQLAKIDVLVLFFGATRFRLGRFRLWSVSLLGSALELFNSRLLRMSLARLYLNIFDDESQLIV